jgi:hypothetical protein
MCAAANVGQQGAAVVKRLCFDLPKRLADVVDDGFSKPVQDMANGSLLCPCLMFGDRVGDLGFQFSSQFGLKLGKSFIAEFSHHSHNGWGRDLSVLGHGKFIDK